MNTIIINDEVIELIHEEFTQWHRVEFQKSKQMPDPEEGVAQMTLMAEKYINIPAEAPEELTRAIVSELFTAIIMLELKKRDEESV